MTNLNFQSLTTNNVKVSVEQFYQKSHSRPSEHIYVFTYRVTVENLGIQTVQLLRRHWFIVETAGLVKEVEGEGVIGQQPIILPGESHQYVSWTNMNSEIGKMYGYYTMIYPPSGEPFKVYIPEFPLVAPQKLN